MTDAAPRIAPEPVAHLEQIERHREGGAERRGFVPLDRNERVGPLPEWLLDEIREAIDSELLTSYPATDELHAELAAALSIAPEQVLVTPGTDPVLRSVCQAYVRPGDVVAMVHPSYAMYDVYARVFGAAAVHAGFDADLHPDLDALVSGIGRARVAFVANPNQPTGTVFDIDALRELIAAAEASGCLLVIDEAYGFFGGPETRPLVDESENVLIARTFSKAGFAGIRIGYLMGSKDVVATLFKVRSAADTNALAIATARILLRHPEVATDYARAVGEGRAIVEERARSLGLDPLAGTGNFLSIRVGSAERGDEIVRSVRERGFLIRGPYPMPPLNESIRVTVGPPDVMAAFADALAAAVADIG